MPLTALRPMLLGVLPPALALLLGLVSPGAEALGLGRPQVHSALGAPLDASIPLTLADGEQLTNACLRAEVTAGDARVPAGLLQMRVEGEPGQQRIRLLSIVRIEEPALRITLALGCPVRLTREFNAFVDPPASSTPTAAAPPPPPAPAPVPVAVPEPAPRVVAEAPPPPKPKARARTKPRATAPRLVLDRPEVPVSPAPQRPVASTEPDTEMTPELEAQITQLEQTVAQLRAELEIRQAEAASAAASMAALPASAPVPPPPVAEAPVRSAHASAYSDPVTWLLMLGLSLLAGSAAFYGSRWLDQRARRDRAYWRSVQATAEGAAPPPPAPTPVSGMAPPVRAGTAAPLPDEGQHTSTRPQPRPLHWVTAPAATPEDTPATISASGARSTLPMDIEATQPVPVQPQAVVMPAQPLTPADELLDLQQQVDFLLLLGQHEAAADLLANRLTRGTSSAMPYLMLMELCQQRGEPEVFAELAKQFEQRFHTPASAWSDSLSRGRSLDACPSVIAHLQVVWADAEGAMQMLQTLLNQGKGPGVQNFELPSYRDLLTLYSVARDLFEAGLRNDDVDLMLPIDSQFGDQG